MRLQVRQNKRVIEFTRTAVVGGIGYITYLFLAGNFSVGIYEISYFMTAVISYVVLRKLNLECSLAFAGAIIYDFLPMHYLAKSQLDVICFFVIPLAFWSVFSIVFDVNYHNVWIDGIIAVVLAGIGFQYACFEILLLIPLFIHLKKIRESKKICRLIIVIFGLLLGSIYSYRLESVHLMNQVKTSGLRIWTLFLPVYNHRVDDVANIVSDIYTIMDVRDDEYIMALGFFTTVGLIISLILFFLGRGKDELKWISKMNVLCLLLAAVDGVGILFTLILSTKIWSYQRIVPIIGFGSLLTVLMLCSDFINKKKIPKLLIWCICVIITLIAILDQTPEVML